MNNEDIDYRSYGRERGNADILIEDDRIVSILSNGETPRDNYDETVDATGCFVLPGVIDDHVHFRDPGLTHKADMQTESRAAAYGGVTTYFDMPNTKPQTTTLADLEDKLDMARQKSHVNYSFFIGATNDNIDQLLKVDTKKVPGVKLFMGSSTGNMLVDREKALRQIFTKVKLPIMTHCEDTGIINRNMAEAKKKWGEDPDICHHPEIRSVEACWQSTELAVKLAKESGARLHVAHLTTEKELELFEKYSEKEVLAAAGSDGFPKITAEAVVAHLVFTDADYKTLGARIKCNPAVKTAADRDALRSHRRTHRCGGDRPCSTSHRRETGWLPECHVGNADASVLARHDALARRPGCADGGESGRADEPQSGKALRSERPRIPASGLQGRHRGGASRCEMDVDKRRHTEQVQVESVGGQNLRMEGGAYLLQRSPYI